MKTSLGHDRAIFMKTCSEKNLSENACLILSEHIKNSRLKDGSEAGDKKAKELTELINSCKTEEEILEKLNFV